MRHLLLSILFLLTILPAKAQKGLYVNEIFEGDIVKKTYMVDNLIKGEQLKPYKLTFFRSIKFKASEEERRKIEELVNKDLKKAIDLEQERQGENDKVKEDGKIHVLQSPLSYAMMTLEPSEKAKPDGASRWYLCYQCTPFKTNEYAITLVFMKGNATINELRKMFKKN